MKNDYSDADIIAAAGKMLRYISAAHNDLQTRQVGAFPGEMLSAAAFIAAQAFAVAYMRRYREAGVSEDTISALMRIAEQVQFTMGPVVPPFKASA